MINGFNLEGLDAIFRRHPLLSATATYADWAALHAAHILTVDLAAELGASTLIHQQGQEIHERFDEAMQESAPDFTAENTPWNRRLQVVIDTSVLFMCLSSLCEVRRFVQSHDGASVVATGLLHEEDPRGPLELLASAENSFLDMLEDLDAEFPLVAERIFNDRPVH